MFHQVVTLEADVQEPRAAAAEMSADLARLGLDNGALQQDMGRKRQRLGGQEQAPAVGRALYQEYLRCLRLACCRSYAYDQCRPCRPCRYLAVGPALPAGLGELPHRPGHGGASQHARTLHSRPLPGGRGAAARRTRRFVINK